MSYSRWSDSVWYTYADVNGGFTVCSEKNFTDDELKDIPKCLEFFGDRYTKEQLEELASYMKYYLRDTGADGITTMLKNLTEHK